MSNYRQKRIADQEPEKRNCVLYLRVSSARQTHTAMDVDRDGNSIATQREQTMAKADELHLVVAREFVEPGVSAQTIEKRPVFRQMLAYVSEHPEVGAIIVYSRSRAFRNVEDAMMTRRNLRMLGVKLVSTKEDFGDSIEAEAMQTISDTMNELQNRLNGQDIRLKMGHKAKNGGTISRAPLGYLNTRIDVDGHQVNSIALDSHRAPLVRQLFERYATGEYTVAALAELMRDQGLSARPTGRYKTPRPLKRDTVERILGDPYYAGWIYYDGQLYPGRHEPLISQSLFDRVQDVLDARSRTGVRNVNHHHYLKGMLWCARCAAHGRRNRLIYTEAKGGAYTYYGCMGRNSHLCDLPYLRVEDVEEAVLRHYSTLYLPEAEREQLADTLDEELATEETSRRDLVANLNKELTRLDEQSARLLNALMNGLAAEEEIQRLLNDIQLQRHSVQERLNAAQHTLADGIAAAQKWLTLATHPQDLYQAATDDARSVLNRAFFARLLLDLDDGTATVTATHELNAPLDTLYADLTAEQTRGNQLHTDAPEATENDDPAGLSLTAFIQNMQEERPDRDAPRTGATRSEHFLLALSSNKDLLVGDAGFEPATSSV